LVQPGCNNEGRKVKRVTFLTFILEHQAKAKVPVLGIDEFAESCQSDS